MRVRSLGVKGEGTSPDTSPTPRRDHYVRYGLAFMLEHGFMKQERGRLCYRMNLEQIRNAILETAYLGVLDAYLRCKRPSFLGGIRSGMQKLSNRGLAKALATEVQQFAMIQKNEYGFDLMDAMGKKSLKLLGVTPNLWILPEGMKMYLNLVRKENFQAFLAGESANAGPVGSRTGNRSTDVAVDVANDCRVVETKSFELPNMSEPLDPMQRPATIGEYYTMQNHLRGYARAIDYRSSWRDIFIYNEDKDGFTRISLEAALRNCQRFQPDGSLKPIPMNGNFDNAPNQAPPDMFLKYDNGWEPTEYLGDIHGTYLRDGAISDWAETFMSRMSDADKIALRGGYELCREIDSASIEGDAQNHWSRYLWMAFTLPRTGSTKWWNDEHGIPNIPTNDLMDDHDTWQKLIQPKLFDGVSERALFVPVGYANYPGLRILAQPEYEKAFPQIHPRAKAFVAAFENLYIEIRSRMNRCVFTEQYLTPPWFHENNGRNSLFSNVFYVSYAPLWIRYNVDSNKRLALPQNNPVGFVENSVKKSLKEAQTDLGKDYSNLIHGVLDNIKDKNMVTFGKKAAEFVVLSAGWIAAGKYEGVTDYVDKELREILKPNNNEKTKGNILQVIDNVKVYLSKTKMKSLMVAPITANGARVAHSNTAIPVGAHIAFMIVEIARILADETLCGKAKSPEDTEVRASLFIMWVVNSNPSIKGCLAMLAMMSALFLSNDIDPAKENSFNDKNGDSIIKKITNYIKTGTYPSKPPQLSAPDAHVSWDDTKKIFTEMFNGGTRDFSAITDEATFDKFTEETDTLKLPDKAFQSAEYDGDETEFILETGLTVGQTAATTIFSNVQNTTFTQGWKEFVPAVDPNAVAGTDIDQQKFATTLAPFFNNEPQKAARNEAAKLRRPNENAAADADNRKRFGAPAHEQYRDGNKRQKPGYSLTGDPFSVLDDNPDAGRSGFTRPPLNESSVGKCAAFQDRWISISRDPDPIRRAVRSCFLGQPVHESTFLRWISNDDVFPFGFLLLRPYMTYSMASAILTVAGSVTGETLVGHADFQLADNVVQKMHIGNFTMYLKSIVYQPHQVNLKKLHRESS